MKITIRRSNDGTNRTITFGVVCGECPLREACTTSKTGRTISVGQFEAALAAAQQRQTDSGWQADYRATRSKVERKLAHLMFPETPAEAGGPESEGQTKVAADSRCSQQHGTSRTRRARNQINTHRMDRSNLKTRKPRRRPPTPPPQHHDRPDPTPTQPKHRQPAQPSAV
ncbi:MAG: transposase [Candidatus Microthrix sp.]|nr:transposase [Candidatus Microthrix sp.]